MKRRIFMLLVALVMAIGMSQMVYAGEVDGDLHYYSEKADFS